jgi:hypothetical protein
MLWLVNRIWICDNRPDKISVSLNIFSEKYTFTHTHTGSRQRWPSYVSLSVRLWCTMANTEEGCVINEQWFCPKTRENIEHTLINREQYNRCRNVQNPWYTMIHFVLWHIKTILEQFTLHSSLLWWNQRCGISWQTSTYRSSWNENNFHRL